MPRSEASIFMPYGLISGVEKQRIHHYVDYQKFYQNLVNGGFAIGVSFILLKTPRNRLYETHGFQDAENSAYFATRCISLRIKNVRVTYCW